MTWLLVLPALAASAVSIVGTAWLVAGRGVWGVVAAYLERQGRRLLSYRFQLFTSVATTAMTVVVVVLVARGFVLPSLGDQLASRIRELLFYLGVGVVAWPAAWAGYQASSQTVRREQMLGTLESVVATPAGVEPMLFSSFLATFVRTTVSSGVLLVVGFGVFSVAPPPAVSIPVALVAVQLGALFLWGVGLAIAGLTTYYKETGTASSVLRFSLIVFSGVYFPIDVLPGWGQALARLLPLTSTFSLVRESLSGAPATEATVLTLVGLLLAALASVAVGLHAFRWSFDRARRSGMVTGY